MKYIWVWVICGLVLFWLVSLQYRVIRLEERLVVVTKALELSIQNEVLYRQAERAQRKLERQIDGCR